MIVDEITEPTLDGTRGSGLYTVPFRMNRKPSSVWSQIFVDTWNHPPSFSTMHRPGIASVRGAKIVLEGTTIEEVRRYHRDTLIKCVEESSRRELEILAQREREAEMRRHQSKLHKKQVGDTARNISFD